MLQPRMRAWRFGVWLALAAVAVGALWILGRAAGESLPAITRWVDGQGGRAPLAFVFLYAVATVALVPASLFTLVAGALFGVLWGTVYTLIGAVIGTAGAFLVSRHVARPVVEARFAGDPRVQRLDRAIGREGLKIVFLLRLSPVLPYNVMNYALGLTRVRFRDYLLASVGMIPGTLLYVYYGKAAGDLARLAAGEVQRGREYYLLLGLGLVATLALALLVARLARRALDEEGADPVPAGVG